MNGWVHVITGPMYSGKTDLLIRRLRRYDLMGHESIVFRPLTDNRIAAFASRSGLEYPSHVPVPNTDYMLNSLGPGAFDLRVVAIDEAQFFDDRLPSAVRMLADSGITVLVAGLDRDFQRRPFGPMADLLVEADEVTKLTAVCFRCKAEATLTQRLVDGKPAPKNAPIVYIGGMDDDKYEARCREHHEVGA